jgi:hypothetical protein
MGQVGGLYFLFFEISYMPTFQIYEGFSQFEVVKKANPDIPIGIAKIHRNPDFLKTSPI